MHCCGTAAAAADAIGGTARPEGGGDADAAEAQASIQRRTRLDAQLRQARLAAADPAWLLATQLDDAWLLERLRHWAGDAHWRQVFAARLTLRQWREWLASRLAPADAERALARLADAAAATVAPTTTAGAPPAAFAAALLEASLRDDAGSDAAEEDVDAPWRASAAAAPDQPDATGISVRPRPPAQGTTSATAAATAPPTEPTAAVASQLQGEIRHAAGPARDHTGMDDMAVMAGIPGIADVADVASVADVADVAGAATAPPQSRAVPALPESPWAEALAATARCLDLLAGACAAAGLGLDASAVRRVGTRVLAAAVVAGPQGFALARLVEAWFAALPQAGLGLAPPASAAPAARSASAARWRQALAQALALGSRSVPRQPVAHAAPPATTPAAAAAVAQGPHTPGPPQAAAPPAGAPRVAPSPARAEHARDVLAADTAALQARLAALLAAATPAPNGRAVARDAAAAARVPAAAEMPAIDERSEALYLANAGLVLAGPYLPRLLSRLGLLAGERFVDDAAARRAVQVLQVVVDGRRETPEHALVLNKLLCGWPQAMPVAREITLDDAEERAITGMLEAMIKHWGALGKTSVAGLRQSFLQREGVLTRSDEGWRLLVQPRPYDMLLDRLPWGFRTIKYPWMEQVLHVDWR